MSLLCVYVGGRFLFIYLYVGNKLDHTDFELVFLPLGPLCISFCDGPSPFMRLSNVNSTLGISAVRERVMDRLGAPAGHT